MSYDAAGLWEYQVPPALPEISDDQFLALLSRQFQSTNKDAVSLTANPQSLTRFPLPFNLSPLPSEESSPSPPGSSNDALESQPVSRKQSTIQRPTRSKTAASASRDDDLKRKASFDEDEEDEDDDAHMQHKSFDSGTSRKNQGAPSRRKSSGHGGQKDENRLLKRKEQNRAAQRAFRERKEKHVKDLEDKVAQLEAKSELQAVENDNLRDLLGRLQHENLQLRESSFTFSVPAGSADEVPLSSSSGSRPSQSPAQSLVSNSPPAPVMSAESTAVPYGNLVLSPYDQNGWFNPSFFNTENPSAFPASSTPMPFTNQGPYTTIASNPLYMSFADTVTSFPWFDSTMGGTNASSSGTTDIPMTPPSLTDLYSGFDGLVPFNGNFNMFSSGNVSSSTSSLSPVAHRSSSSPSTTAASGSPHEPMDVSNDRGCPNSKEEMAQIIAAVPSGTFGPPMATPSAGPAASDHHPPTTLSEGSCERILPSDKNISLDDAWTEVSKQPQFAQCDVEELCAMLTAKAKCDGLKPVIEPGGFKDLLQSIPALARK